MPISDFQVAFCGIATVAATLGYACARRAVRSLASQNEPDKPDVEAGSSEERSLKRKLDDDAHDTQPRPMKRNRTPPAHQDDLDDDDFNHDWEVIVAPPSYEEAAGLRLTPPPSIEHDAKPVREITPPADPDTSRLSDKGEEAAPQPSLSPNVPETPPSRPVTPPKPSVPASMKPMGAFSAYSGSGSPFGSYSNPSGASPFALSGQTVKSTPAWKCDGDGESDVFGQASATDTLASSPNDVFSPVKSKSPAPSKDALAVSSEPQSLARVSNHLTGEEDETVETELKGVKLFTKRGRKEFSDGIYGHVKILTQKSTPQPIGNEDSQRPEAETNSRTRLLFRRDPLGQVSMNVGLQSTVRCHFDAAENILRVIMMEKTDAKEDIIIYALKPGRAQKADFQSFARALCDHEGLKSRLAGGDAAAS